MKRRTSSDTDSENNTYSNNHQIRERAKKAWEDVHVQKPLLRDIVNSSISEHVRKNFRRSVVRRALNPNIVTSTPCVSASTHLYPNFSPIISVTDVENKSGCSEVQVDNASIKHHTSVIPKSQDQKRGTVNDIEALNGSGLNLIDEELGKKLSNENNYPSTSGIKRNDQNKANKQNDILADISRSVQNNVERLSSLNLNKITDVSKPLHSRELHQTSLPTAHITHPVLLKNDRKNIESLNFSRQGTSSEKKDFNHSAHKNARNKTSAKKKNSNSGYYSEENGTKNDIHNVISVKSNRSSYCKEKLSCVRDEKNTSKKISSSESVAHNLRRSSGEKNRLPCYQNSEQIDTIKINTKKDDSQKTVDKDKVNILPHRSIDRSHKKKTDKVKNSKKSSSTTKNTEEGHSLKPKVRELDSNSIIKDVSSNESQTSLVSNNIKKIENVKESSSGDVTFSSSFQEKKSRSKTKKKNKQKFYLKNDKYHTKKKYKTKNISSSNSDWEEDRHDDENISMLKRRGTLKCRRCTKFSYKRKYRTDSSISDSSSLYRDPRRVEKIRRYNNEDVSFDHKNLCEEEKKRRKYSRTFSRPEKYRKYKKGSPLKKSRSKSIATKKYARNTGTSYKYRSSSYSDSDLEVNEDSNETIKDNQHTYNLRQSKLKKLQRKSKYKIPVESIDTEEMLLSNFKRPIGKMEAKDNMHKFRLSKLKKLQRRTKNKVPVESIDSEEMQDSKFETPVDEIESKDEMNQLKSSKLKKLQRRTKYKVPVESMDTEEMLLSNLKRPIGEIEAKDKMNKLRPTKLKKLQRRTKYKVPVESIDSEEMQDSKFETPVDEIEAKDEMNQLKPSKLKKLQLRTKYKVPVESIDSEEMQDSKFETPVEEIEAKHETNKFRTSKSKTLQRQTKYKVPVEHVDIEEMQLSKIENPVEQVEVRDEIDDAKLGNGTTNSMICVRKKSLQEMVENMVKSAMFGSEKVLAVNKKMIEDNSVRNHTKDSLLQEVKAAPDSLMDLFRTTTPLFANASEYSLIRKPFIQNNSSSNSEFGTFRPSGSSTIASLPEVCFEKKTALRKIARKPFTNLNDDQVSWGSDSSDINFCFYKKKSKQRCGNETPNENLDEPSRAIVGKKEQKCDADVRASEKKLTFRKVNAISAQTSSRKVDFRKSLPTSQRNVIKAKIDEALGIYNKASIISKEPIIERTPQIVDRGTQSSLLTNEFPDNKAYKISKNTDMSSNSCFPLYQSLKNNSKEFHPIDYGVKPHGNKSSSFEKATTEVSEGNVPSEIFKSPRRVSHKLQSSRMKLNFDSDDIDKKKRIKTNIHNVELGEKCSSHQKTPLSESKNHPADITLNFAKEGSSREIMTITVNSTPGNNITVHNSKNVHSADSALLINEEVCNLQTDTRDNNIPLNISTRKSNSHDSIDTSYDHPPQSNIKLLQNITLKQRESVRSATKRKKENESSCSISKEIDVQGEKVVVQSTGSSKNQKKKPKGPIKGKKGRNEISSYPKQPEDNEPYEGVRKSTRQRRPPQAIYWKSTLRKEEVLVFENFLSGKVLVQENIKGNIKQKANKNSAKTLSVSEKNLKKKEKMKKEVKAFNGSTKRVGKFASERNTSPEPKFKSRKLRMNPPENCTSEMLGENGDEPVKSRITIQAAPSKVTEVIQRTSTSELEDDSVRKIAGNVSSRTYQDTDDPGYLTTSNGTDHENQTPTLTSEKASNSSICEKIFREFRYDKEKIQGSAELEDKFSKSIDIGEAISSGQHFGYVIMAPSHSKSVINVEYDVMYCVLDGQCSLYVDDKKKIKERNEIFVIDQGKPYKIENELDVTLALFYLCYKRSQ